MPQINTSTFEDTRRVFTSYTGNANEISQTFTFNSTQNGMTLTNKGKSGLILTVDGVVYRIPPGATIEVDDKAFVSFDVKTKSGSQDFVVKSFRDKTNETGNSQAGILTFQTLTELQNYYPNGINQPAWVAADKDWYYWDGIISDPVETVDTTPPVLTITAGGTFTGTKTVTMSANETADIWYTVDGNDPKTSGTRVKYSSSVTLTETTTVNAYAVDTAGNESAVQSVTYTKEIISEPSGVKSYFINPTATTPFSTSSTINWKGGGFTAVSSFTLNGIEVNSAGSPTNYEIWDVDSSMKLKTKLASGILSSTPVADDTNGRSYLSASLDTPLNIVQGTNYLIAIQATASGIKFNNGTDAKNTDQYIDTKNLYGTAGSTSAPATGTAYANQGYIYDFKLFVS